MFFCPCIGFHQTNQKTNDTLLLSRLMQRKSGDPESNQGPSDRCRNQQPDALPTELSPEKKSKKLRTKTDQTIGRLGQSVPAGAVTRRPKAELSENLSPRAEILIESEKPGAMVCLSPPRSNHF